MLTLKIENEELENKFLDFAKKQHRAVEDVAQEAIRYFMNKQKEDKFLYTKKDPLKHLHKIEVDFDDEDLSDVKLFDHIEDSAKYIHNLRKQRNS
ncbi:MAG: hypothetical protein COB07_04905 [Sulfurovum sp.]|nr:MAG: hypothetical protein COB07_04905 [Sulfurovum sp.]